MLFISYKAPIRIRIGTQGLENLNAIRYTIGAMEVARIELDPMSLQLMMLTHYTIPPLFGLLPAIRSMTNLVYRSRTDICGFTAHGTSVVRRPEACDGI